MDPFSMVVSIVFLGCATGVITTAIKSFGGGKQRAQEAELGMAQERARQQELQIVELRRQNEQLQKQLDWHSKLLETQDRMIRQLGAGSSAERPVPGQKAALTS